jgi:transcriptional regulator with XRE-family HTH domain
MRNTLLRTERLRHGWSQQQLADFALVSLSTIERAERGEAIRVDSIQRLCECLSKTSEELGLLKIDAKALEGEKNTPPKLNAVQPIENDNKAIPFLESNGFFSFGNIETTLMVLDGNGTEAYSPLNIRSFYDFHPVKFNDEIENTREIIAREQTENEKNGKPPQWNGDIYHLANYILSRDPIHEQMKLSLWFRPTDYYTILAKNRCLKNKNFREKYAPTDWESPLHSLPIPFGIGLSLLTSDGYILFGQRSRNLGVRPGYFMTSVEEGLSRPLDRGTTSEAPDVYRCACRGLSEELGLTENTDFSISDILFLALGLDTEYYMCGLRGLIKSQKSAREIMKNWEIGVKDKMENKKLYAVPFTPEDVCAFVFSHEPWGGGALMGIYHTLVHEFGKERVNSVLSSYK